MATLSRFIFTATLKPPQFTQVAIPAFVDTKSRRGFSVCRILSPIECRRSWIGCLQTSGMEFSLFGLRFKEGCRHFDIRRCYFDIFYGISRHIPHWPKNFKTYNIRRAGARALV